jgi:5-formyltetrahydrofolate cyclo-ligase
LDIPQQKKDLRKKLLQKRESIPEPEYYGSSADIVENLKEQGEFKRAETIHCYVSMNVRREVETRELIKEMISKGKQVVVPITNFERGSLRHVELNSYSDLEPNKWGVLEPEDGEEIALDEIDLVVVPMVGADEHCNRIGYGKGFYDRFLREVECPTIGLIFDQNIVANIPTEDFDVPLDKIISDMRIIER